MKKYPLSLSPDYCSDWDAADAIREVIQNCLDSEAPFIYSYDSGVVELTSTGVTLPASTLLLGNTSKRGDGETVGGYGEGYKIALLLLCREGHEVIINNGDKRWLPTYEYNDLFESQALVIYEEPSQSQNQDLTFTINGVDEDLWDTVVERCLYLQDDLGEVIETEDGRILKDIPGKLFVGGLYITDTELQFSYDFHPSKLRLNRDRKSVSGFDLEWATSRMWVKSNNPDYVAELIHNKVADVGYFESGSNYGERKEVEDEIFGLYKKMYDGKVLASDYTEQQKFEERGVKNVIVIGNSQFTDLVRSHPQYEEPEEEEAVRKLSPAEHLQEVISSIENDENLYPWEYTSVIVDQFKDLLELFEEEGVEWR